MSIRFEDKSYSFEAGESVLECLLRHDVAVSNSCRSGVCQSCLLTLRSGAAEKRAVAGLSRVQLKQDLLLACQQSCSTGLELVRAHLPEPVEALVTSVEELAPGVAGIRLVPAQPLAFEAGQFVHVMHPENDVFRAYSIANTPASAHIDLQVRVLANGALSPWLAQAKGQTVRLRGPFGGCTYVAEEPDAPLVLAGVGTGAAPLLGVIDQALASGHRGSIVALFGARAERDLYMQKRAGAWGDAVQVRYSVLEPGASDDSAISTEPLPNLLKQAVTTALGLGPKPWVYLCGDPGLVQKMKRDSFLAGLGLDRILSDPFAPAVANASS